MTGSKAITRAMVFMAGMTLFDLTTAFSQPISPSEPAILTLRPAALFVPDQIIPKDVRYLPDAQAMEAYLVAMDGAPPPWEALAGPEGIGDEEGLAKLNARRDQVRQTRRLMKQRIAFLWSGTLLAYDEAHAGFTISFGPEMFETAWGEARFRPEQLPLFLIAVPPNGLKEALRRKVQTGEPVSIRILMFGRLSSILYGFSHEHRGVGSVIPRVLLDEVQLFLEGPR